MEGLGVERFDVKSGVMSDEKARTVAHSGKYSWRALSINLCVYACVGFEVGMRVSAGGEGREGHA
jgi:hypothetical protein